MSEKTFSEINEGWLKLCEEYEAVNAHHLKPLREFNSYFRADNVARTSVEQNRIADAFNQAENALHDMSCKMEGYRKAHNF